MHNDLIHRKLFHKIHLKMRNTKQVNNIENSFKLISFLIFDKKISLNQQKSKLRQTFYQYKIYFCV